MASRTDTPQTSLRITRTFPAPPEAVFRAWTEPEALKRWFAPGEEYSTPVAEVELRVGGRYRIEMQSPGGKRYCVVGTYREIRPPERLVFSWIWEDEEPEGETLVTVEFRARGNSTEVVLTHELFSTEQARQEHEKGWAGCLDRLARMLGMLPNARR